MQQKKLFIGNLPFTTTEQELEEVFAPYGDMEDIKVIIDRETGRSRGFAFVTYTTIESALAAIAADGQNVAGRCIRVNIATERPKNNSSPRGRNGGFERNRNPHGHY